MDALAISHPEQGVMRGCTQDKLCVEIAPSQTSCNEKTCGADVGMDVRLMPPAGQREVASASYRFAGPSSTDEDSLLQLWPKIVRYEGGILVGVETQERAMYSGGGATSTTLHLIAFLPGQLPFKVLRVPQHASVMIRACFNELDMKRRAGACHDEYNFDATLTLVRKLKSGMPVFRYRSKATSFPGAVSRSKDSLAGRPLRKRDLITVTDPQCSYRRMYRFDPQARRYVADTPPPDCSNYTTP